MKVLGWMIIGVALLGGGAVLAGPEGTALRMVHDLQQQRWTYVEGGASAQREIDGAGFVQRVMEQETGRTLRTEDQRILRMKGVENLAEGLRVGWSELGGVTHLIAALGLGQRVERDRLIPGDFVTFWDQEKGNGAWHYWTGVVLQIQQSEGGLQLGVLGAFADRGIWVFPFDVREDQPLYAARLDAQNQHPPAVPESKVNLADALTVVAADQVNQQESAAADPTCEEILSGRVAPSPTPLTEDKP